MSESDRRLRAIKDFFWRGKQRNKGRLFRVTREAEREAMRMFPGSVEVIDIKDRSVLVPTRQTFEEE